MSHARTSSEFRTIFPTIVFLLSVLNNLFISDSGAKECSSPSISNETEAIKESKVYMEIGHYKTDVYYSRAFSSELYKNLTIIGKFIESNGWFVGEIKKDSKEFFGVDFSFDDGEINIRIFVEMNGCGVVRDYGHSFNRSIQEKR